MDQQGKFYELAPLELHNFRVRRYQGDDLCLPLSAFVEEDQKRLRTLYDFLQELFTALLPEGSAEIIPRLTHFLERRPADDVAHSVGQLGKASYALTPAPLMAKTIHDLRGGGLTGLLGQLQLAQQFAIDASSLNALYFLTRDHLKIMRNALLGLDDAKRDEDLLPKIHGTDFIVQKWNGATIHRDGREVRLEVDCAQPMPISECCVEFGALDRILYNLINNACRHAASDSIRLTLIPIPDLDGKDLRFILMNAVSPPDLQNLRSLDLGTLFQEGTSTTGSGYGLAIASDFVSHAYGLQSHTQAVEGGYLGATLMDDSFAAWFHWPRIVED